MHPALAVPSWAQLLCSTFECAHVFQLCKTNNTSCHFFIFAIMSVTECISLLDQSDGRLKVLN